MGSTSSGTPMDGGGRYDPPKARVQDPENSSALSRDPDHEALRRVALEAYAQDDYYLDAWQGLLSGRSTYTGFNWYAAIFGASWCLFRKMYLVGIIVFALAFLVAGAAGMVIGFTAPTLELSDRQWALVATVIAFVLVRVPFGFLANGLYFRQGERAIGRVLDGGANGRVALAAIRSLGGVSVPALLIAIAVSAAMRVLGW